MQSRTRYCRYHEAPQVAVRPSRMSMWLKGRVWGRMLRQRLEGRKRILPGFDNTNLGAGWHTTYPVEKDRKELL